MDGHQPKPSAQSTQPLPPPRDPAGRAPRGEVPFTGPELDQLVEPWYRERIHTSVVARITECVNHVRASVDDLKSRLGIRKGD